MTTLSQPQSIARFASRRSGLRLVKTPVDTIYGPHGRQMGMTKGETIEFHGGLLDAADAEQAEWLRSHARYGDKEEGFWELPQTAPEPTAEEMGAITDAAINADLDALHVLHREEMDGWQRQVVLRTITRAISTLSGVDPDETAPEPVEGPQRGRKRV